MKKLNSLILAATLLVSCATTPEGKITQIHDLTYAASSLGTQVALRQEPAWRSKFTIAYESLNTLINSGVVSGAALRGILASLPVKELKGENAKIIIETATTLYDMTVGTKVNLEAAPYTLAAAKGIRDGLKVGLAAVP